MAHPNHIAQELLIKAHPPELASAIFTDKVLHKPLHLRPSSPDPASQDARAQRRLQRLRKDAKKHRSQNPKPLSAKTKRILGIYDIPDHSRKYTLYEPLHRMWLGYIREILGMKEGEKAYVTANGAGSKLASADYHGAELLVVRSRCVGMVGLKGIVIRDTKFTFQIITKQDQLKTIPKNHTIFSFEIPQRETTSDPMDDVGSSAISATGKEEPNLVFELHGSQFESRAADRATKKFKQKNIIDI